MLDWSSRFLGRRDWACVQQDDHAKLKCVTKCQFQFLLARGWLLWKTRDLAPGNVIETTAYNGGAPAPLLRFREGVPALVEITNDSSREEYVHWHGFLIRASIDGAMEEGSLAVAPGGKLNYVLIPQPGGARYVHSHVMAGHDLTLGTYSGQFGFVYIQPRQDPGAAMTRKFSFRRMNRMATSQMTN